MAQQAAQQFVPVAAPPCKRERSSTGLEFNSDFEFSDNSNQGLNSHFFEDPISNDNSLDHSLDIPEVQLPESLKQEKQLPELVKREKEKQLHENVKREKEKQIPEKVKREKEKQLPENIKQEKEKQLPEILKQGKPEKQILPENIKHEKKEKPEKHNLKHEKHAKPEKKPKKVNRFVYFNTSIITKSINYSFSQNKNGGWEGPGLSGSPLQKVLGPPLISMFF